MHMGRGDAREINRANRKLRTTSMRLQQMMRAPNGWMCREVHAPVALAHMAECSNRSRNSQTNGEEEGEAAAGEGGEGMENRTVAC